DSRSCWLHDDLADFNTENAQVQNYLIGAYNKYRPPSCPGGAAGAKTCTTPGFRRPGSRRCGKPRLTAPLAAVRTSATRQAIRARHAAGRPRPGPTSPSVSR
ncbi:hypothetical protein ABZS71_22185, partial [Streptomyces sp. NPDC005393]|uniref:hypothetical protein n=1 Tax=Streptomyces sp. NPDC005393 TaxID=3157041 RepID=UPI00339DE39D